MGRTRVAHEIDQKGLEEIVADAFVGEHEVDVEQVARVLAIERGRDFPGIEVSRSEEHTSELQSLMRISYADLCLKEKNVILDTIGHANNVTVAIQCSKES